MTFEGSPGSSHWFALVDNSEPTTYLLGTKSIANGGQSLNGKQFSYGPWTATEGTYTYFCPPHQTFMKGKIHVSAQKEDTMATKAPTNAPSTASYDTKEDEYDDVGGKNPSTTQSGTAAKAATSNASTDAPISASSQSARTESETTIAATTTEAAVPRSTAPATTATAKSPGLFFSEVHEGSSFNKYFEVYNGGAEAVDLFDYAFPSVSNSPKDPGLHDRSVFRFRVHVVSLCSLWRAMSVYLAPHPDIA